MIGLNGDIPFSGEYLFRMGAFVLLLYRRTLAGDDKRVQLGSQHLGLLSVGLCSS
jgi:hypothetical protein